MKTSCTQFPRRTFVTGAVAFGALAAVNPKLAFADRLSDAQAEADAAYASLKAMEATLSETSDTYTEALQTQEAAHAKMEEAQAQIDDANKRIATLQEHLGTSVCSTYKSGTSSFLDVLMGATSFEEFATSLDLINTISEDKAKTVVDIKDERTSLQAAKEEYAEQERVAAEQAEAARQAKESAEATVAQYQATYDSLSSEVADLVEQKRASEEAAAAARAEAVVAASAAQGSAGGGGSYQTVYDGGSDTVSRARACLGAPYIWAAVGPYGYDCSGLVSYCVTGNHQRVWTTYTLMNYGAVSDPSPGDIAVNMGHCGVYIGGGQMIHASCPGIGVIIGPVQGDMKIVRP